VCVCVGFVMCGCFGNLCTCIYCVLYCLYCFLYSFVYVYLLFVLSVLVLRLLPPSGNSIAVNNNNNINNITSKWQIVRLMLMPCHHYVNSEGAVSMQ